MPKRNKVTGATAGKPEPFPAGSEVADQTNRLMESMETYTKHRVQCWCCGESDSTRDVTEARYARELYQSGWRYETSEKYQSEGVLCPECAKTPDAERGED